MRGARGVGQGVPGGQLELLAPKPEPGPHQQTEPDAKQQALAQGKPRAHLILPAEAPHQHPPDSADGESQGKNVDHKAFVVGRPDGEPRLSQQPDDRRVVVERLHALLGQLPMGGGQPVVECHGSSLS